MQIGLLASAKRGWTGTVRKRLLATGFVVIALLGVVRNAWAEETVYYPEYCDWGITCQTTCAYDFNFDGNYDDLVTSVYCTECDLGYCPVSCQQITAQNGAWVRTCPGYVVWYHP